MLKQQSHFSDYLTKVYKILSPNPTFDTKSIRDLQTQVANFEVIVPIIGAFSAGKSTLINGLLGTPTLPIGITPETELATELRYSPTPYLLGIKKNGTEERFPVDSIQEVNHRASEFQILRLYLDNKALKAIAPVVLVDMPGFNSSLENHNKAIAFYMPRGMHFIAAVSSDDGSITNTMLHHLIEIQNFNVDVSLLLTKTDLRPQTSIYKIVGYIEEQLSDYLEREVSVTPADSKDGSVLQSTLHSLDLETICTDQILNQLKDINREALEQINFALQKMEQNADEQEAALAERENALNIIQGVRDKAITDAEEAFSNNAMNRCMTSLNKDLQYSLDELVEICLRKDQQMFSNEILSITRRSLTQSIKIELSDISDQFIKGTTQRLLKISKTQLSEDDSSWIDNLETTVRTSFKNTTHTLKNWKDNLDKSKYDQSKALYKAISTILAVSTDVIAPIIELVIIFLPEVLRVLFGKNEKEKIRERLQQEIFPSIKAEIRKELPDTLSQGLVAMLNDISDRFENKISKQQALLETLRKKNSEEKENQALNKKSLEELRSNLQNLATRYLY